MIAPLIDNSNLILKLYRYVTKNINSNGRINYYVKWTFNILEIPNNINIYTYIV